MGQWWMEAVVIVEMEVCGPGDVFDVNVEGDV